MTLLETFIQLNLNLDLAEAQALEKRIVLQGESKEWLEQHRVHLTAFSFGKVFQRVYRPSEAMVKSLFVNIRTCQRSEQLHMEKRKSE